jgi:thiol:disulfide interchange protein DsbD
VPVRPGRGLALAAAVAVACIAVVASAAEDVVHARLDVEPGRAVVEVTIAPGWHVNAHVPRDDFLIPTTLTLVPPTGVRAGDVEYPAPVERRLAFGGDKKFLLYEGTVRLTAPLDGAPEPGGARLRGGLRYQACDDSRCLPPRTIDLEARADAAAPAAESGAGGAARVAGWVARWGWAATFVWVALLGVALNLTPCVYPLISVTVAFFGGRTAADHRHALRRSLVYVVGICLSFSALGVAAALTGSLFGAALQRPAVLATIAAVLVGLAGSNFGLWQIRVPYPVMQRLGRIGEGDVGAFLMGLTMGVVAAPCIGPVVAALLLFVGARQSVALGFALFFVLGLGMGAPYVALARVAGRLRALPRAGAWLEWIEHVFGFLLLGLALYFVAPVLPDVWMRAATVALLASAGLVLGFLGPETSPAMRWPRRAAGVAIVGLALVAGVPGLREGILGAETGATLAWSPFSDDALGAAVAARKPVLIDFEAEWCIPCREMAHTTFRDPRVVRAAAPFAALKVDLTREDGSTEALTKRFQVAGVPTYLLLGADGVERRRLAGFQAAPDMIRALEDVAGG